MKMPYAVLLAAVAACSSAPPPPPAAAPAPAAVQGSRAAAVTDTAPGRRFTDADVRFMQGMIAHHAQAVEMAALVPTRTSREEMRTLARRIDVSQRDEMTAMRQWLAARGQTVPDTAMHHDMPGMQHAPMPGMLTPEEMARLAAASGAGFDRLFLQGMIRHHRGALEMVARLFATQGAAQEPETFRFASDVDADQRAEIARMERMLAALPSPR
jgi:uncharacterized protein (DUF305 family)